MLDQSARIAAADAMYMAAPTNDNTADVFHGQLQNAIKVLVIFSLKHKMDVLTYHARSCQECKQLSELRRFQKLRRPVQPSVVL